MDSGLREGGGREEMLHIARRVGDCLYGYEENRRDLFTWEYATPNRGEVASSSPAFARGDMIRLFPCR